jgi:hypothetical protein
MIEFYPWGWLLSSLWLLWGIFGYVELMTRNKVPMTPAISLLLPIIIPLAVLIGPVYLVYSAIRDARDERAKDE